MLCAKLRDSRLAQTEKFGRVVLLFTLQLMRINRKSFFQGYRAEFNGVTESQVKAIEFLLGKFEEDNWNDVRLIAYCLATIKHETANTYLPIKEYRSRIGSKGRANQDRYWLSGYYGRGFVQVTWLKNYQKLGKAIGADLVANPNLALQPAIAYEILVVGMLRGLFTGKKLSDYINSTKTDYANARRVVNGTDKSTLIAQYARQFEKILKNAQLSATGGSALKPSNSILPEISPDISADKAADTSPQLPSNIAGESVTNSQRDAEQSEVEKNEPPAPATTQQTAENIINTGDAPNMPPDFKPEDKPVNAPAKEGSTETATKMTVLGFLVPPSLVGVIKAAQELVTNGFINTQELGNAVLNLIIQNTKYVFYLIGLIIGLIIVKKVFKQISFLLQMYLTARPDTNNPIIVPTGETPPTGAPMSLTSPLRDKQGGAGGSWEI